MPPVPSTFATMPLNSSVVAVESTFGPMTLNTVEPMANSNATAKAILKRPIKRMSLPTVPLKSRGFSVTIMRPAGPPGLYPRFLRCAAKFSFYNPYVTAPIIYREVVYLPNNFSTNKVPILQEENFSKNGCLDAKEDCSLQREQSSYEKTARHKPCCYFFLLNYSAITTTASGAFFLIDSMPFLQPAIALQPSPVAIT